MFLERILMQLKRAVAFFQQPQPTLTAVGTQGSQADRITTLNNLRAIADSAGRFLLPVLIAFAITTALFLLMQGLISNEQPRLDERESSGSLTFIPQLEDNAVIVEPPVRPKPPPPIQKTPESTPPKVTGTGYDPLTDGAKFPKPELRGNPVSIADGNFLPIVTVAPEYPRRMATRGVEGWVLLTFTVDELGRVLNPSVVDAEPSSGFNKAALTAIARFKFKPQVVNGVPMAVSGVQQRIVFQLENR
jgi:protein TonB